MISTNDTTIIAMLSKYPNMPSEEADDYISKIENEENIMLCYAVIGRISRSELSEEAQQTYDEFQNWSQQRTQRVREEQWNARKRREETQLGLNMNRLFEKGMIGEETLLLYGISGTLPDRNVYFGMSPEEKQNLWEEKMLNRFGPNWKDRFSENTLRLSIFNSKRLNCKKKVDWKHEGF